MATKSYWIILFQVNPVPAFAPGPIKAKVNRASYENAVEAGKSGTVATLIHEKQEYKITGNQRCFQMNDGFEIFLIADAKKVTK